MTLTRSSTFGEFRLLIDPWEVDYGDQTPLESWDEPADELVDHQVELPDAQWSAIEPAASGWNAAAVLFIDGVRRLDLRVQARKAERLIFGGFGSYAVGAAEIRGTRASFRDCCAFRSVVLGAGECLPAPFEVRERLTYANQSTPATEPDGPLRHIQSSMRRAEGELAHTLCQPDMLVIADGPLSFEPPRRGLTLGYIKRLHKIYLPQKFLPLLATLPAGCRTPLFAIQGARSGFARYSWFQRLADPGPGITELHGLVRLEVEASVGLAEARRLADAAAHRLPGLAPRRARDPRSPQNLLPIGALEQRLRLELGDARLIRRWIETRLTQAEWVN